MSNVIQMPLRQPRHPAQHPSGAHAVIYVEFRPLASAGYAWAYTMSSMFFPYLRLPTTKE
jgi:hypothetical protein